jgi:ribosomal protein S18 acetylase RimI-like enzyme
MEIVPIQQLSDGQVMEVAKLHHAVLHSLLSELGLPFVERYYQIAREDDSVIGLCAFSEEGKPLGWVIGSSKPEQVNGRLREPLTWFIPQLVRVLLKHPGLFWQLVVSSRSASSELKPDCIELVYIGVGPSVRGQGLGRRLMDAFIQASAEEYSCVTLSVEEENAEAIQLYTKAGYRITETIIEGKFKRHRMELKI